MFLVTKHAKTGMVHVFNATAEIIDHFNVDEEIDAEIGGWKIESAGDLERTALTNGDMLKLYNTATEGSLVKFQNKKDAAGRTFDILDRVAQKYPKADEASEEANHVVHEVERALDENPEMPKKKSSKPKGERKPRKPAAFEREASTPLVPVRAGTKQALVIDALAKGATFEELVELTSAEKSGGKSWAPRTVRTQVVWHISARRGYGLRTVEEDGRQVIYLTYPDGHDAPVPHIPRKSVAEDAGDE